MELIKKIKQAEAQAQEIIEIAKAESVKQAEKGKEARFAAMTQVEQQRKKTINNAVAEARSEAEAEVQNLKAQAQNQRRQLRDKSSNKIASAAAKVMEYLRG
jgi:V/A-type H+-transporting ATPase subunit G/H